MASDREAAESRPKIVVLTPPPSFRHYQSEFSLHFHFLKAYESPLPLPQFLAAASAAGVPAMLTTSYGPPITCDAVLRHFTSLRCIVNTSAGTNHIDLAECRSRGITVANAADAFSTDCADMAFALLLDVLRKISASDQYVRNGLWKTKGEYDIGNRLGGKQVGIVGFGNIGSIIAARLEAFGCGVSYTSRKQKQSVSYPYYSDVCELAANSDVLVLCCALTDETRHSINKEVLSALGKEGIIINVSRGAVVDEPELVRSLVEGKIAGAGLDVFENEPEVPKELFDLDNVVLSFHQAVFTPEAVGDMYKVAKANLEAFFSGKPLLSQVV